MTVSAQPDELFRFLAVRPPQSPEPDAAAAVAATPETTLHSALRSARTADNAPAVMAETARAFVHSRAFLTAFPSDPAGFRALDEWVRAHRDAAAGALRTEARRLLGADLNAALTAATAVKIRERLGDSLIALAAFPEGRAVDRDRIVGMLQLWTALERLARPNGASLDAMPLRSVLDRPLTLPGDVFPVPPRVRPPAPRQRPVPRSGKDQIARLVRAYHALQSLPPSAFGSPEGAPPRITRRRGAAGGAVAGAVAELAPGSMTPCGILPPPIVTTLPRDVLEALDQAGLSLADMPIQWAIARLRNILSGLYADVYPRVPAASPSAMLMSADAPAEGEAPPVPEGSGTARPVGIADLMLVRQKILRYELGEIAHIENVLRGESQERRHRRLQRVEESFLRETDHEEERGRDLQTTERFELQRETERTLSETMQLEGGVKVTARYGPAVEVTAHTDISLERAREESARASTTFSREVTEKSANRVRERVREERTRRSIAEVEETNVHGFNNVGGSDHIAGVYRFVEKVYLAQVVNYGRRLMFEFIVPEPAALHLHLQAAGGQSIEGLEEPAAPTSPDSGGPLAPADIQPWNYQRWVAQYRVADVEPPPEAYRIASTTYKTEQQPKVNEAHFENAVATLELPQGYIPVCGYVSVAHVGNQDPDGGYDLTMSVVLGRRHELLWSVAWNARAALAMQESATLPNGLPLAVASWHELGAAVTVEVLCRVGEAALAQWQQRTYEAIIAAYQNLRSQYDERIAARRVARGPAMMARPDVESRAIERRELKRGAIALLTSQQFDGLGAVADGSLGYPELQFDAVAQQGPYIQFFEQAFEWTQIAYVFYPYFWARKARWPMLVQIEDPDPVHREFLQAGAARVLVPVRPGYESAVLHYLESGAIWSGGGPPQVADPTYLPIVEELRELQGGGDAGTPVGEPWEVRLPTTLVMLQEDASLPAWPVS